MDQKLAVLFMPDDMTLTKEKTPLMLRPILFCPILTWMVEELMGRGIERFFIVSDKRAHDMMRPYVPENADVVYVDGARHGEELLTLLKDEKGSVLIVNGAVLPVGVFSGGAVYSADAKECCKVLKEHGAFAAFPKGAEITKGFLPVGDDEELRSAQDMCRRKIADKHFAAGVSIMDQHQKAGMLPCPCHIYQVGQVFHAPFRRSVGKHGAMPAAEAAGFHFHRKGFSRFFIG